MKALIHLDDALLKQADEAAQDLGLRRSGLIAEALRFFLRQHRQAHVTEQLNRAYEARPTPGERLFTRKLRTTLPVPDAW